MTTSQNPILIDVPMPIRTPCLLIRPQEPGDGAEIAAMIAETYDDLYQWMPWAEEAAGNTPEKQEIRVRASIGKFWLREEINLLGIEIATGRPVIGCGLNDIDWQARQANTGFWVRKDAQGRGFATESTNALIRYAFEVLKLQRLVMSHSEGNDASRRIIEKLGFAAEGVKRQASYLPGGRKADSHIYARLDASNLPPLDVRWGAP